MSEQEAGPPTIPGFSYLRKLGSGGFAEVYLFQQAMPRREVAVKVLSTRLRRDATVRAFEAEANLMATVSAHPSIVTVYQADISPDGRPYLVMEYCPRPTLQERTRRGRMSLTDALRVGVQLAGAVETAHRAGILHRDIKPGNVLFTRYDHPALADFGIAGTLSGDSSTDVGLSVPWSPPEAFGAEPVDARLDVYALGATVFAMLEGHPPFHVPGGTNGQRDQMQRIRTMLAPPLTRGDVPDSLRAAVARALEKDPSARQRTAIEFGHDLQRAQDELDMPHTAIDVLDQQDDRIEQDEDETLTHVRGVVRIDPTPRGVRPAAQADPTEVRVASVSGLRVTAPLPEPQTEVLAPPVSDTMLRPRDAQRPAEPDVAGGPSTIRRIVLLVAAVLVTAIVAVVLLLPRATPTTEPTDGAGQGPSDPEPGSGEVVPRVTALKGVVRDGTVHFSWSNPSPRSGDAYLYNAGGADDTGAVQRVVKPEVTVRKQSDGVTCISVYLVRGDSSRSSDQPARTCVG